MISVYSRIRRSGRSNSTPWNPSITRLPEEPSPQTIRPPEIVSSVANSWAMAPGDREKVLRMPVPIWIFSVLAAITVSQGNTECPQASPVEIIS